MKKMFLAFGLLLACWMVQADSGNEDASSPFDLYTTLVEEFYQMTRDAGARWQQAVDDVYLQKVLVLTELSASQDYQRHADALQAYRQASNDYHQFLVDLEAQALAQFEPHQLTPQQLDPVIKALVGQYQTQRLMLLELVAAHRQLADHMQTYLGFLQTHQAQWTLQQGKISIADPQLGQQHNQLIDQMVLAEDQIEAVMKRLYPKRS